MLKAKLIGAFVAVVLCLVVILQNTQAVEVRFLTGKAILPNAALLGIALLIGFALGILFALWLPSKRRTPQSTK